MHVTEGLFIYVDVHKINKKPDHGYQPLITGEMSMNLDTIFILSNQLAVAT